MHLYKKSIFFTFFFLLLSVVEVMAQDETENSMSSGSSITLAVVMPSAFDGFPDAAIAQLGNKLAVVLTNSGLASTDEEQAFTLTPTLAIPVIKKTAGGMKQFYVANCTFTLFIKQASTKLLYSSFTKNIQGTGFTEEEAKANIINSISVDDVGIQGFLKRGKDKIVKYYQQNCQVFMTDVQRNIALKQFDAANKILKSIPKETGQCYEDAQVKATEIFEKQYGDLDKAVVFYEKQVTINPYSSIFKDILNKAKDLVSSRKDRDKTPPQIELLTPKVSRGQTVVADVVTKNQLYVDGNAIDPSGISTVNVNGKPANSITEAGFFQAYVPQDATDIIIEATDKKGNAATQTFHIAEKTESKNTPGDVILPISDNEKFHAIFIANTDYSGSSWHALPTTIGEALELRKMLIDKYSFDAANIDTVFNKNRAEILTALTEKLDKLTPNDNLVIFYGGHGYYTEATNMAYWVPLHAEKEYDYISNTNISDLIKSCNARHILIMADACFSGAMRGGADAPSKYEFKNRSRQLLTSGGTEPVPGKSAYVKMLLTNLNSNEDKYISARDLQTRIYPGIKNEAHTECTLINLQVPGSEGGQFYFKMK